MEEWSNNAAFGYVIRALERLGYNESKIQAVINMMRGVMDMELTVEEAKEVYDKSQY
jgi:Holliday junction resolvasome RuvABC DNA-binding subunit